MSQDLIVRHLGTLSGHNGAIYCMCYKPHSSHFFSSGGDGWIVSWPANGTVSDGKLLAETSAKVFTMEIHPNQDWLFAGDINGHIYWIDLQGHKIAGRTAWHTKSVFALRYTPHGLLSAGGDGLLCLWDIESRQPLMSVQLSAHGLRSISYDINTGIAYVGASDNNIYVWNVSEWKPIHVIKKAHDNSVFSLMIPEKNKLLSGGRDAHLVEWNTGNFEPITKLPAHWYTLNSIVALSGTPYMATASRDKTIRIWDINNIQPKCTLNANLGGHVNSVNTLVWLEDHQVLVSAGDDRLIKLWSVMSAKGNDLP